MYSWKYIAWGLSQQPKGTVWRINKNEITSPISQGGRLHFGLPKGQSKDYRFLLANCKGLHAQDFGTYYNVHIDQVDPECSLVEHLRQDAPQVYVAGSTGVGVTVGYLIAGTRGLLIGGFFGLAVGVLAVSATSK